MQGRKILIIDNDAHILRITDDLFKHAGAEVFTVDNGREGLRQLYTTHPDLVVLDIMLPEVDGYQICHQIRQLTDVPVIMLTALNSDEEIVRGLDCGADDFITKPFSGEVLLARARAVLRRRVNVEELTGAITYSDDYLLIDIDKHRVLVKGEAVKLTPTEYRLLAYLVRNAGRVRTFDQILENVWGWEYRDSFGYVHVYVSHIRGKIEVDPKQPRYIITEHGLGYRFVKLRS